MKFGNFLFVYRRVSIRVHVHAFRFFIPIFAGLIVRRFKGFLFIKRGGVKGALRRKASIFILYKNPFDII